MRFSFLQKLCDQTVVRPRESKEHERSRRIDAFLTGKYTAIPAFVGIMALVFFLTFNVIGAWFQALLEGGISWLTVWVDEALTAWGVNAVLHSLVIDGIFNGVGSVLSFVPIIVTLFFFLSLLEDSGYMARVAFVMDKLLRKIGLSGRSIVPMLIGFGCTVPGVMASRTLPSERDRKMTILLTPFMSCRPSSHLWIFYSCVLPRAWGAYHGGALLFGNLSRHSDGAALQADHLQRRGRSVCYGTAQLPDAWHSECGASSVGQSQGFSSAGIHGYFPRDHCGLVPSDI